MGTEVLVVLKVSKSQKHYFLKLHFPKNELNIWQNSARASYGRILSNISSVSWAMEFQEKCFWDLLTFRSRITYLVILIKKKITFLGRKLNPYRFPVLIIRTLVWTNFWRTLLHILPGFPWGPKPITGPLNKKVLIFWQLQFLNHFIF